MQLPKVLVLNRQRFDTAYKVVALMDPLLQRRNYVNTALHKQSRNYLEHCVSVMRLTLPLLSLFEQVLQKQRRCLLMLQKLLNAEPPIDYRVLNIVEQHTRDYVFVTIAIIEALGYNKRCSYTYRDMDSCIYLMKIALK
jgi:hypothetical protein